MPSPEVNRNHLLLVAAAGVAIGLYVQACGSSSGGGGPIAIDDLPGAMADAVCGNLGSCCTQAGFSYDSAQCRAAAENAMTAELNAQRSTNAMYDAAAARACVDMYAAAVKACAEQPSGDDPCSRLFVGKLQPGDACSQNAECAPGSRCLPVDSGGTQCVNIASLHAKRGDGCTGTCTESQADTSCFAGGSAGSGGQGGAGGAGGQGAGGAGGSPLANCYTNDGLYCDAMHNCAATPELGQPCADYTPCSGEAFCNSGVCTAKGTSGPCGQLGDGCTAAAYCETTTRECAPRKPTGSACASSSECLSTDRCDPGTCRTRTIASAELCMGTR
jgi:hypothetical protein